jgi:hypothetical protein
MNRRWLVAAGLALASLVTLPVIASAGLAWHANVRTQDTPETGFGPGDVMSTSRAAGNDIPDLFGNGEPAGGGSSRNTGGAEAQPVPEPATLLLVGLGSLAVAATRRRTK